MISSYDIINAYNDLYRCFRKYIWSFDTIYKLAELEAACYTAIQDINLVRRLLDDLYQYYRDSEIFNTEDSDEFESAFSSFKTIVESSDDIYFKITRVNEVIDV